MNSQVIITVLAGSLALSGTIYTVWGTRKTAKEAQATATIAAVKAADVDTVKAVLDANKNLIDDLTADRQQLRAEMLQDRKSIADLRSQLDTCLQEKSRESIEFAKKIAVFERQFKLAAKYLDKEHEILGINGDDKFKPNI